jgi:hypothetical protein
MSVDAKFLSSASEDKTCRCGAARSQHDSSGRSLERGSTCAGFEALPERLQSLVNITRRYRAWNDDIQQKQAREGRHS